MTLVPVHAEPRGQERPSSWETVPDPRSMLVLPSTRQRDLINNLQQQLTRTQSQTWQMAPSKMESTELTQQWFLLTSTSWKSCDFRAADRRRRGWDDWESRHRQTVEADAKLLRSQRERPKQQHRDFLTCLWQMNAGLREYINLFRTKRTVTHERREPNEISSKSPKFCFVFFLVKNWYFK